MRLPRAARFSSVQCRAYTSPAAAFKPVPILHAADLATFRAQTFEPAVPALLPRGTFRDLPAREKWFVTRKDNGEAALNAEYLAPFAETAVPVEISGVKEGFARVVGSLGMFVEASSSTATARVYVAQAPLSDLPQALRDDVPTPALVTQAGKGDIYDSSIWLGRAPTYTPLHRDPNPNLFVQLAGRKVVRMLAPREGQVVFARVQERVGGRASATMRGEEMMCGAEREVLEEEVWGKGAAEVRGLEAQVEGGDGLFIPKGWWHSIKGVGEGMTGSVNWWFR